MTQTDEREVVRRQHLAEKIVFVDGLFGCGKTMLSPIVGALDRVELPSYAYELEYVCALYGLGKMTRDAAETMVRMVTDLQLYNTMMSRETNFRPSDLSSVFRSATPWRYVRRLFQKGDEMIPERIREERPILLLTTHNMLSVSEPIFAALRARAVLVEVVRHPLYMLKQQTLNMEGLHGDVRDFTIYFRHGDHDLPFFVHGWEEQFLTASLVERAIYYMHCMGGRTRAMKERMMNKYGAQILTIPFERFVIDPNPYLQQITSAVGTTVTRTTKRMMRKQRVPRQRYAEGLKLGIYERCGWEPPEKNATEKEELRKRRHYAVENSASDEALYLLDELSATYEATVLGE